MLLHVQLHVAIRDGGLAASAVLLQPSTCQQEGDPATPTKVAARLQRLGGVFAREEGILMTRTQTLIERSDFLPISLQFIK